MPSKQAEGDGLGRCSTSLWGTAPVCAPGVVSAGLQPGAAVRCCAWGSTLSSGAWLGTVLCYGDNDREKIWVRALAGLG